MQITRCFDTEAVIIWLVLSTCFLSVLFKDIIYIYHLSINTLCSYDMILSIRWIVICQFFWISFKFSSIWYFHDLVICKIFGFSYVNLKQKMCGSSNYFHSQSELAWMVRFFARIFALYYHVNIRRYVIWYINDLFLKYIICQCNLLVFKYFSYKIKTVMLYDLLELLLKCNFAILSYWKCNIDYIVKWIREIFDGINCSQHKLVLHEL